MNKAKVELKLTAVLANRKRKGWPVSERTTWHNVSGLRFKPTKGLFEGANVDYDPETGLGHSYRWYELAKQRLAALTRVLPDNVIQLEAVQS